MTQKQLIAILGTGKAPEHVAILVSDDLGEKRALGYLLQTGLSVHYIPGRLKFISAEGPGDKDERAIMVGVRHCQAIQFSELWSQRKPQLV